jgi:type II secretory pathway component PulF
MLTIAADERAALQLDDVASALDAGLSIDSLHGDAAHGDRALHASLRHRGIVLNQIEDTVLSAAWRAGRASASLRSCAAARRQRAEFQRQMWVSLRYPMFVLVLCLAAAVTTAPVIGHYGFVYGTAGLIVLILALLAWARHSVRRGGERIAQLPVVGRVLRDMAELPYLEVLGALYGAGVPLVDAHSTAITTVKLVPVQQRLVVADQMLRSSRPLAESLNSALALNSETRSLIDNGERSGTLEEALQRALERRRQVVAQKVGVLAKRIGAVVYTIAVVVVVAIVFRFYGSYISLISGRR